MVRLKLLTKRPIQSHHRIASLAVGVLRTCHIQPHIHRWICCRLTLKDNQSITPCSLRPMDLPKRITWSIRPNTGPIPFVPASLRYTSRTGLLTSHVTRHIDQPSQSRPDHQPLGDCNRTSHGPNPKRKSRVQRHLRGRIKPPSVWLDLPTINASRHCRDTLDTYPRSPPADRTQLRIKLHRQPPQRPRPAIRNHQRGFNTIPLTAPWNAPPQFSAYPHDGHPRPTQPNHTDGDDSRRS